MERGFTLIEIMVVIVLFTILVGLGLFMSLQTIHGTLFRSERDIVVTLLQKARSRAIANTNQNPWGVCYSAPDYVVFAGTTCPVGGGEHIPASVNNPATFSDPNGIVFTQLSATSTGGMVTVVQNGGPSTITVNNEGTILW